MRILFNTSPNAFKNMGGGEIQLLKTKAELERLGHKIEIFNGTQNIGEFDLVHNFNIHRDTFRVLEKAFAAKVPVAISTIYWPSLKYSLKWNKGIGRKAKAIAVELINRLDVFGFSSVKKTISQASVLLPNSEAEKKVLVKQFRAKTEKIFPVCNGVDARFANANKKEFEKKFGLKDFVLYTGRIEERKNVLALIRAMNKLNEKLVIIGDAKQGSEKYYNQCRAEAGENIVFLKSIPHDSKLLESAYAACGVFALPSWYETPGLAALEAGLAGANIVVTREGCTKEYFGWLASFVNPADKRDIEEKITYELKKGKDPRLRKHIMKNFLWENTGRQTLEAYKKI
ncbi:MAG: glycosyltransferase family 4 protein [Candidatus Diapherotrites archaeon]|nr:glycosyltransferase family 4 protein [Candidatus Diapherotrites archaeon]